MERRNEEHRLRRRVLYVLSLDAFERAWVLNAENSDAATNLGLCFERGIGRPRDRVRSRQVLTEACRLASVRRSSHVLPPDKRACEYISGSLIVSPP